MSETVQVAVITGLVSVIGTWLTTRRRFNRVDKDNQELHALSNSRLTEALEKIEALSLKVERQRVTIDSNKEGA